jgi:WD40 repeat protein
MDGTGAHRLLPNPSNPPADCCGKWTADGRYYIFLNTKDRISNVWALPEHSSLWRNSQGKATQLTTGPLQFQEVLPSKDGKELFVVGVQQRAELVRYDATAKQLIPFLGGISAGDVDFSRDGNWVAYTQYPEGTLWRSRSDGSDRLQLTFSDLDTALAHWSPDGQQIAFAAATTSKTWRIFLIPKEGGSPQPLLSSDLPQTDPSWSPDGKTIALGVNVPSDAAANHIELVDLASRKQTELENSAGKFAPRWSPDGRYIAAIVADDSKLSLFDTASRRWQAIDTPTGSIGYLAWSPDSTYLFFDTLLTNEPGYFRVRIKDANIERVVDLKNVQTFPSQFGPGSWTGLAPGNTPLFVRDISLQEIYALRVDLP